MRTEVDVFRFRELIGRAQRMTDQEKRIRLLRDACELYSGDFLQNLSGEEWVLMESVRYKNMYTKALEEVCAGLMERGRYEEALKICSPACEMYPLEEWQGIRMECYIGMERYEDARREYESTAKLLLEELGVSPSLKMMEHLRIVSEHIKDAPGSLYEIREKLRETEYEKGAVYCSLPSFRDMYCIMRRIMDREGKSVYLMLCTIVDGKGYVQKNKERLGRMSQKLYEAIKYNLRRCDSFTRYNAAQFLILLVGTSEESCSLIFDRINRQFSREHRTWANYLNCCAVSVAGMENRTAEISFNKRT